MKKTIPQQYGNARVKTAERAQVEMQFLSLDQWLDKDHSVRTIWQFVEALDLTELYESIKAIQKNVGRDAIDPRILLALWLFATIEGCTSGRRISVLTTRDIPYMWLCGGVSINYHRICDFRTQHVDLLDKLLTSSIAALHRENLITLDTVAQDGMRVRASAGSGSFRKKLTLDEALDVAEAHMEDIKKKHEEETDGGNKRRNASIERAAKEKVENVKGAIVAVNDIQGRYDKRSGTKRSKPRASTTDPDARRMKMGDGGTRPAMNVQFVSDGDTQMIVSVEVTSQGSDSGLMKPAYDDLCQRYDVVPENYIVDGGFIKKDDITHVEKNKTKVFAPLYGEKKQLDEGKDPYAPVPKESPEMTEHRRRMGTDEAKIMKKRRPAIAEFPNADCRNRGLTQFRVRGLVKAKAQTLWHALAFNFMRMRNLKCPQRNISYLEIVMAS